MEYTFFAGIDVSLDSLTVVVCDPDKCEQSAVALPNTPSGHRRLIRYLQRFGGRIHACLEPTSVYHLALTASLYEADAIDVSVVSTSAIRHYAHATCKRAKTDSVDAALLADYARAQAPVLWQPPRRIALALRSISRHVDSLVRRHTALKCQQHSAQRGLAALAVLRELKAELRGVERRIGRLRRDALALIKSDQQFARWYILLLSVPGIAATTAIYLIGELGVLPPELTKKQWLAMAGLDPQPRESGKSVHGPRRIIKKGGARMRRALFMPAMASRRCAEIKTFYEKTLMTTKSKLSALVVVMRKLLQAIWGMFHHDQLFNPALFCQK